MIREDPLHTGNTQAGFWSRLRTMPAPLILLFAVLIAYWRCLLLPFIQDDWLFQSRFHNETGMSYLLWCLQIKGFLFFRPLSYLYLYLFYLVFGPLATPYHVAALLIHTFNSILVLWILRRILADEMIARCAALLYALASPVHLESLMWSVGINDLGAALFMLLSLFLFLERRSVWSAAAYLAGCLFKESIIVLPLIPLGYLALGVDTKGDAKPREWVARLIPYAPAVIIMALIKLLGVHPIGLPEGHPYLVKLVGYHLLANLRSYAIWIAQSIFPVRLPELPFLRSDPHLLSVLFLYAIGIFAVFRWPDRYLSRRLAFLGIWMAVPLLLIVFLPNHCYRYYLIYSTPPFLAGLVGMSAHLLRFLRRVQAERVILIATAVIALLSVYSANLILAEGLGQRTFADGTNWLVRRAAFVNLVRDGLRRHLPDVPDGAVILLGDIDLVAFDSATGPRLWYGKPNLTVYPLGSVRRDNLGLYIETSLEWQGQTTGGSNVARKYLSSSPIFSFLVSDGNLTPASGM